MATNPAQKRASGPNINNEAPGVGAHCQGVGQMTEVLLQKFNGSVPEVVRVTDPYTGFAQTVVRPNGLTLTQAQMDTYLAMT